jgi:hypothetical protein
MAGDQIGFAKWTSAPTTPPPLQDTINRSTITLRDLANDNRILEASPPVESEKSMSPRYDGGVTKVSMEATEAAGRRVLRAPAPKVSRSMSERS